MIPDHKYNLQLQIMIDYALLLFSSCNADDRNYNLI